MSDVTREAVLHLAQGLRSHMAICHCREGRAWMRWAADMLSHVAPCVPSIDDPGNADVPGNGAGVPVKPAPDAELGPGSTTKTA